VSARAYAGRRALLWGYSRRALAATYLGPPEELEREKSSATGCPGSGSSSGAAVWVKV